MTMPISCDIGYKYITRFAAAYDEIRRIIREDDPPRPSTRLTTLGEGLRHD